MAKRLSPPPKNDDMASMAWQQFFQGVQDGINNPKFYIKPGNPTVDEVPLNTYSVWKNSTTNQVRLWANTGGVLVGVTLT